MNSATIPRDGVSLLDLVQKDGPLGGYLHGDFRQGKNKGSLSRTPLAAGAGLILAFPEKAASSSKL